MSQFDSLIIGEVAQDTNVDYDGTTVQAVGGAVYYSGFAAANIGHGQQVAVSRVIVFHLKPRRISRYVHLILTVVSVRCRKRLVLYYFLFRGYTSVFIIGVFLVHSVSAYRSGKSAFPSVVEDMGIFHVRAALDDESSQIVILENGFAF